MNMNYPVSFHFIFIIINTQSNFMVIHHRKCFSCKSIFIYANWFFVIISLTFIESKFNFSDCIFLLSISNYPNGLLFLFLTIKIPKFFCSEFLNIFHFRFSLTKGILSPLTIISSTVLS